jgi:hypothetical protein
MQAINMARLAQAKWAFTTRRVNRMAVRTLINDPATKPSAGDLVLARVVLIGQHTTIELPTGRKAGIFPGDEIVVSYGNRYAPDQFEALVPPDLGMASLVAGGGIAGRVVFQHEKMVDATVIEPIGLLGDQHGIPLNLRAFAMKHTVHRAVPAFAVFGTSMNAGKTTTVARLVKGLTAAGYRVGAAKITGTGAGNDLWSMRDAGAHSAYDFTDAGFATTYLSPVNAIIDGAASLLSALARDGAEVAVVEVADGLFQEETAAIAAHLGFRAMINSCLFAAGDSMGAVAGVKHLRELGYDVAAISGLVTRSPLGIREAGVSGLPVLSALELTDAAIAEKYFAPHIHAQESLLARVG